MKSKIIIFAAIALAAGLASCARYRLTPSGHVVTEIRDINNFRSVSAEDGLKVVIAPAEYESVVIDADDNLLPFIETYKTGSNLTVRIKSDTWIKGHPHITVTVNAINLTGVSGSGGSDVSCTGSINASSFFADMSGGSKFSGELDTDKADISLSGGSRATLSGWSFQTHMRCSGGSYVMGYNLTTNEAYADLSGGSDTELTVNNTIEVTASGGSRFKYRGNGTVIRQNLTGGSEIRRY